MSCQHARNVALIAPVTGHRPVLLVLGFAAFLAAQDLPLPQDAGQTGTAATKPTVTIKPPVAKPVTRAEPQDAREAALQAMERAMIEEQQRKQLAQAAKQGDAVALRQLIVMAGPVDSSMLKAPKPPATIEGKVALIGLNGGEKVTKSLEQFFGAPLTPDRERQLLETVKSQLAGKGAAAMDVKVAGWWPKEGVMAVTLVPRS